MPHASSIVIAHGGTWTGKDYSGGEEELILIPVGHIKFTDLLSKIELRIMKPKSRYVYEIYALVKSPSSEIIKMKIMDDIDVDYVLGELETPVLYITTTPLNDELLEVVNPQASRGTKAKVTIMPTNASRNKFVGNRDLETDLDRNLDRDLNRTQDTNFDNRDFDRELDQDLDRDLNRNFDDMELDRELDRNLDNVEDDREEDDKDSLDDMDCCSIRQNWVSIGSRNDVFEGDQQYTGQWIIPGASYHLKEPTTQERIDNECIYDDTLCKDARLTKVRVSDPPRWTAEEYTVRNEAESSQEPSPQHAPLVDCIRTRWPRAVCNWDGDAQSIV